MEDEIIGAGDEMWVFMWAKVRILGRTRCELYHASETDTGREWTRMLLPRQAIATLEAVLLRAISTRQATRITVDLAAVLEAKREMK